MPLPGSLGVYDFASIRSLTQEDPIGLTGGLNLYGFANGDPVNFSDPFGLCPPDDNNNGPECKLAFAGIELNLVVLGGVTIAAGHYINGEGEGNYLRVGLGAGLSGGVNLEAGESDNRAAFRKGSHETCASIGPAGGCSSTNSGGKTTSGSGSFAGLPVGYHKGPTYSFVSKPSRTVVSPDNFDCGKPHPQNHVCNR